MATEPLPVADRVELAKAIIELAAAEAATIDLTRGSFDARKRYDKLHGQIDIMLNELDWLLAIESTFGQAVTGHFPTPRLDTFG